MLRPLHRADGLLPMTRRATSAFTAALKAHFLLFSCYSALSEELSACDWSIEGTDSIDFERASRTLEGRDEVSPGRLKKEW